MNRYSKNLIICLILLAFVSGQILPCYAFSNNFVNKISSKIALNNTKEKKSSTDVKNEASLKSNDTTVKEKKDKKISFPKLASKDSSTAKTTSKQSGEKLNNVKPKNKEVKTTKKEKKSFWTKYKEKKQAEKDAEITVTAKTDKLQPSVKIQTQEDKKVKEQKPKKEKKAKKEKKLSKKETKQHTVQTPAKKEMKPLQPKAEPDEKLPDNVFNASASMEGSVSTDTIISVDDCVKIALENNPTILSQMMSKDLYKNKVAQAWANYFPTLNAGVSYSRNDMMVTNFRFPTQQYNLYNTPNVGFNQLIYDFGKTGAQAGVAKKTYEASQENLQASINDIVYQVKNAYYNLLYLQQQVSVYEEFVLQYQIHLQQALAYYEIGSKAKIDVSTAQYNLDNTKLTLVNAKNALENGFAQLTNAMGTPEIPPFTVKDRLDKKRYDVKFEDALQVSYESRPELMAAKKKMEGSKYLIKASKAAFAPNINAFGTFTQGGSRPDTDYGYQIGAQLAYSNLNLYLIKKQLDEAKLTYKKDQADYEVQRQKVYLDVKQAFIQLKNAQQSIPVARSSMDVAKERYDLAAGRYKVGLGDAIELKDAQNEYMTAKLQYYNTLMQYHIAAANLERVMGAPLTATEENL